MDIVLEPGTKDGQRFRIPRGRPNRANVEVSAGECTHLSGCTESTDPPPLNAAGSMCTSTCEELGPRLV